MRASRLLLLLTLCTGPARASLEPCPGLVQSDAKSVFNRINSGLFSITATTCACDIAEDYTVTPGFYKLNASSPELPCNRGSYCPGNITQPVFCCPGYVCSDDTITMTPCEEGYFCPPQSIQKIECPALSYCPARTDEQEKWGTLVTFLFVIVVCGLLIWAYESYLKNREKYYEERIQSAQLKKVRQTRLEIEAKRKDVQLGAENESKKSGAITEPEQMGIPNEPRLSVQFEDLEYTLPDGLTIMSGVSGKFEKGRLVAVMGPSGAGKSTLFNLITGKAKRTGGRVLIEKTIWDATKAQNVVEVREEELSKYKRLIGFVPQDDVMIRNLTVTDILTFCAHRRLPASMTSKEKDDVVAETINTLEIGHIANSVIGDARRRGISGGQRKRVNIGMELVAKPALLFLDEPTTGLDSSTAREVCETLRFLCRKQQLAAAAVIHSPSIPTFNQFDDLCLLGKGGRLIYMGPLEKAGSYFEGTLGYKMPPKTNPADFYLEIAMGKVESKKLPKCHWSSLFKLWEAHSKAAAEFKSTESKEYGEAMGNAINEVVKQTNLRQQSKLAERPDAKEFQEEKPGCCTETYRMFSEVLYKFYKTAVYDTYQYWFAGGGDGVCTELFLWIRGMCCSYTVEPPVRRLPNPLVIFWLCLKRACKQVYGDPLEFAQEQILYIGIGLFLAVSANQLVFVGRIEPEVCEVLSPAGLQTACTQPVSDGYTGTANFMCFAIGFAGIASGAKTFGAERTVFFRHASTGLDALPYFFAKMITDIPRVVIAGTLTILMMFAQFYTVGHVGKLYAIGYLLYLVTFAQGYFITMIVNYEHAPLVGVVFTLFWSMLFSGINIRLTERSNQSAFEQLLFQASAPRWAIEAFYVNEMSFYNGYLNIQDRLNYFQYSINNYNTDIGAMFFITLFWYGMTILFMKLTGRSKIK